VCGVCVGMCGVVRVRVVCVRVFGLCGLCVLCVCVV